MTQINLSVYNLISTHSECRLSGLYLWARQRGLSAVSTKNDISKSVYIRHIQIILRLWYQGRLFAPTFRKTAIRERIYMKTINGIYTSAKIFTDTIEDYARNQIQMPCKYYIAQGECKKGRAAYHKAYCQHCGKYEPRAKVRNINRKGSIMNAREDILKYEI